VQERVHVGGAFGARGMMHEPDRDHPRQHDGAGREQPPGRLVDRPAAVPERDRGRIVPGGRLHRLGLTSPARGSGRLLKSAPPG
jgi:hypothetical protein